MVEPEFARKNRRPTLRATVASPKWLLRKLGKYSLLYSLLSALALFTLFPFLWTLATSLSASGNVFRFPPQFWPQEAVLTHYRAIFNQLPMMRYIWNSLWLCFWGISGTLLVSSLAAYPLACMHFPGRKFIFYSIVATLILPNEAGLIVNFITISRLGLANSYAGVILPSLASVIGIFLMRQAYLGVPRELLDAAKVDGASELRIYWQIMLPLCAPALAALGIFTFVGYWNSFIWPLIVLRDPDLYPLSVGLLYLRGIFAGNTRMVAAGTVLSMVPVIVVFVFAQRYFMRGLEGALKQ